MQEPQCRSSYDIMIYHIVDNNDFLLGRCLKSTGHVISRVIDGLQFRELRREKQALQSSMSTDSTPSLRPGLSHWDKPKITSSSFLRQRPRYHGKPKTASVSSPSHKWQGIVSSHAEQDWAAGTSPRNCQFLLTEGKTEQQRQVWGCQHLLLCQA